MMKRFLKIALLSVGIAALAACGTNNSDTSSDTNTRSTNTVGGGGVATGTAAGPNVSAGDALENVTGAPGNVATVFYFDFDQSTLKPEARDALLQHAAAMKANGSSVRLEGHADERGTREYNIALGERRGNAVAQFLALQGVSSSQIEVISYGEEKPVALGSSGADWAENRRVELK